MRPTVRVQLTTDGPLGSYRDAVDRSFGRDVDYANSTAFLERANLTMRMGMRRFTRLTNAFSKKMENHAHAVALHLLHYNFCRPHTTLAKAHPLHCPQTPPMAAGLTDHV